MSGHVTANLKLNVPFFDQTPWDVDVNSNWLILDAAVGQFIAIPNLAGIWYNAHTYTQGQSAIDGFDSSIWYCLQTHTSPAAPTTFAQDRVLNPARWTQASAGAAFYAQQAANAASAAEESAQKALDAVEGVTDMVPLAGGTMTGPLILNDDPVDVLGAATRQYVDARVGGTGFLPLSGGVLTGPLTVGGNGITYSGIPLPDQRVVDFGYNGGVGYMYANLNGIYYGAIATREFVNASYLPISGGTITGNLRVMGTMTSQQSYKLAESGAEFTTDGSYTHIYVDNVRNTRLRFTRATQTMEYIRGSDNITLLTFGGDGTNLFAGTLQVRGALETDGSLFARQGTIFWGVNDQCKLLTDNTTKSDVCFLNTYLFSLNWGSGTLTYYNPGGASLTLGYDGAVGNQRAGVYGAGPYVNTSDERAKVDIQMYQVGLDKIRDLKPIMFKRVGNDHEEIGFSAQQVRGVLPHAVTTVPDGMLAVALDPIVAALVNATNELSARVIALETK